MGTYWQTAFRDEMKRKGITYAQLADRLRMSVPGIKKVFQKDDISLERFHDICGVLRLEPSELIKQGYAGGMRLKEISPAADAFMAKEPRAFELYFILAIERRGLKEAMAELAMDRNEAYRILRRLDQFELIKWSEGDRIEVPDQVPIIFSQSLRCFRSYIKKRAQDMIDDCIERRREHSDYVSRTITVPPEAFPEISLKFRDLINSLSLKYPYKGESHARAHGLFPTHLLFAVAPQVRRAAGAHRRASVPE